jgi:hypothetical protein
LVCIRMQLSPKRAVVILSLGLCCLVSAACSDLLKNSDLLKKPPSDEAVAAEARVITCEWKAADQYDDNRYKTFSEIAQRVLDACAVELRDARSASGSSPDWPAPGFTDTELGVLMEPEVDHGEAEVYARVQA